MGARSQEDLGPILDTVKCKTSNVHEKKQIRSSESHPAKVHWQGTSTSLMSHYSRLDYIRLIDSLFCLTLHKVYPNNCKL